MTRAIEMGADVVGGIPHYENTRDKGVSSLSFDGPGPAPRLPGGRALR